MKRLVFDLTKIPFLKRLIGISGLLVEVLNDHDLFTESNLVFELCMSSFVQVVISQNENHLKLISLSMQSYYQYIIALVLARLVLLPSESHNSVNFCLILTNYVSESTLRTCITNDNNCTDKYVLRTKIFDFKFVYFLGHPV